MRESVLKNARLIIVLVILAAVVAVTWQYVAHHTIAVLQPAGTIGHQERNLMYFALLLSLIVVIPVFGLTFFIAWKYREGHKADYQPDFDHSRAIEVIWWLIPAALLLIIAVVTWNSSHQLDPFRPLASDQPPLTIQVVALDWKWLFIYPGQQVASVNDVRFPVGTPVDFKITADAPMNSFWIPQLGGQIYAMPGMSTQLHLEADRAGSFRGVSANISGRGFAGMDFTARATSQAVFDQWINHARQSANHLTLDSYTKLAQPSTNNPPAHYVVDQPNLYDTIVMKYMTPGEQGLSL